MRTSIIIFCKDDAEGIRNTLESVRDMDAELIVYDVSNSPGLEEVTQSYGAKLKCGNWQGYGHMRYDGALHASNEWIFMLHSGEVLEEKVKRSVRELDGKDQQLFYKIYFKNYFLGKWLRYGVKGRCYHIRIGNRIHQQHFNGVVNEDMFNGSHLKVRSIPGFIRYKPIVEHGDLLKKVEKEAMLSALNYYRIRKKSSHIRMLFSPVMAFINNYILRGGIFDGRAGFICARMSAWYTFQKYQRLRQLYRKESFEANPFVMNVKH